ncbi:MAG: 16S rRNA (guanine(966)-N(2))-methyltransferase RsmD [Pseudomonadota bacterium]
MRIIAGRYKGHGLESVGKGDKRAHLRPTSDRVRESLFNRLGHGGFRDPPIPEDCRVLDLFAGTGALGLEALSRGASKVVFVERGSAALKLLSENIDRLSARKTTRVLAKDALKLGQCTVEPFDLVFLDPPYGKGLGEQAMISAIDGIWLAPGALVLWEEDGEVRPHASLYHRDTHIYGRTRIHIYEYRRNRED